MLSIGLLVDDAIVVVENTERLIHEEGLPPKMAALKSMEQITAALIGVAAVISAVFVPMSFMGGSTGIIYRQFALTIVSSMVLSVIIAVIFTPSLCAQWLKEPNAVPVAQLGEVKSGGRLKAVFQHFNNAYTHVSLSYGAAVYRALKKPRWLLCLFLALLAGSGALYSSLPRAFLLQEDQGILFIDVMLPSSASFERTAQVLEQVDNYFLHQEKSVQSVMSVMGWGFSGSGQNVGMSIPQFKDYAQRTKGDDVFSVMERANAYFAEHIPQAQIFVMTPPAVMELAVSSGFTLQLMDRGALGHEALMNAMRQLISKASTDPALAYARFSGLEDTEQYRLLIDSAKAGAMQLDKGDINSAFETYWAGTYVNDFSDNGRTKKVYVQAKADARTNIAQIALYYLRNQSGKMVPFSAFTSFESLLAAPKLTRYQGVPAVKIEGMAAPGVSSGQAMDAMERLVSELPVGFEGSWTELSYQERQAGSQTAGLFALSVLTVFLVLAALYESWTIPFAVLLSVPTGLIGALAAVNLRGMENDIYLQIALLTVIGLSAKNSILIVEFARSLHRQGLSLTAAAVKASKIRLRPILMTSLCFILGVLPLAFSSGAGSGAQNALGTAVLGGMLSSTLLGIFITPLFYVLTGKMFSLIYHGNSKERHAEKQIVAGS